MTLEPLYVDQSAMSRSLNRALCGTVGGRSKVTHERRDTSVGSLRATNVNFESVSITEGWSKIHGTGK